MRHFLITLLITKLISCDNAEPESTVASPAPDSAGIKTSAVESRPVDDVSGCYMKINDRDTAILMIDQKGTVLTGKMLYDNFEKDGSFGTIKGVEEKEILKLWYDFQSEGTHSVMEVYFKKDSGRLIRGIGTMNVKTDTTYFTSGVNYSEKEAFTKISCELIKRKFE